MKPIDVSHCQGHVLVCLNQRANSTMPCCGDRGGEEVYERLRKWVEDRGLLATIWITRTECLGWCNRDGVTIVIYPEGRWYCSVTSEDCEAIIARHFSDLVSDRG